MTVSGHHYTSTRVRGLAPWNPKPETVEVVDAVLSVIEEYRSYLPMTARQIFYRLVGAADFEKTERASKRLLEYLNRGRRAGMIPWDSIRDDGFVSVGGEGWASPQSAIDTFIDEALDYRRDRQEGQPFYTEIWVEAAGMMPQVSKMVSEYSIPVYSSGGFNSVTAKYYTAWRIIETARRIFGRDRPTRILHIGDHDPSGVAIIDSLADDIWVFIEDLGYDRGQARFVRAAITPEQIEQFDLPGAPPKKDDKRGDFTDLTVQAEALSPPQLETVILAEVVKEWDQETYEALLVTETAERAQLVEALQDLELGT